MAPIALPYGVGLVEPQAIERPPAEQKNLVELLGIRSTETRTRRLSRTTFQRPSIRRDYPH